MKSMDINILTKSPKIAPLLVRLYDSHKLYSLLSDDRPLAKAEVTSAVAALLEVGDLEPREQELLADVLIGLMRQAALDLRQALAARLSDMDDVPLRLVLHLANDEISVASPVLRKSPVFSDLDLIYIINAKGADYWQAIAAREGLGDRLVDMLADKQDMGTAIVLTKNERIRLTRHAIDILAEMSKTSETLAKPLLLREEVPVDVARTLYEHVGTEMKNFIRDYFGDHSGAASDELDDLILEFSSGEKDQRPFMPQEKQIKLAARMKETGQLNFQAVMDSLKNGRLRLFIALMAGYAGLSVDEAYEISSESSGKKMAVLCRAFTVQKSDFSTIYMLTQRLRSQDRILDQKELVMALRYFDRVQTDVARRIMGIEER